MEPLELPDWTNFSDLNDGQIYSLEALDRLRIHEPVLWQLTLGHCLAPVIARNICWPHDYVITTLRRYVKRGQVKATRTSRGVEWHLTPHSGYLPSLYDWVRAHRGEKGLFNPRQE